MKKIRHKYPLIILAVIVVLLFGLWFIAKNSLLVINVTRSLPYGIYVNNAATNINRGDTVLVCLNDPYKKYGLKQGYLIKGDKCQGSDPLMKTVIALPGDKVVLNRNYIIVNNKKYFYATASFDSNNIALMVYPQGNYINTNGYWLIGTHHKNSWDSRYWGPVLHEQIIAKLKQISVWR